MRLVHPHVKIKKLPIFLKRFVYVCELLKYGPRDTSDSIIKMLKSENFNVSRSGPEENLRPIWSRRASRTKFNNNVQELRVYVCCTSRLMYTAHA